MRHVICAVDMLHVDTQREHVRARHLLRIKTQSKRVFNVDAK